LLSVPEHVIEVTKEQLVALADCFQESATKTTNANGHANGQFQSKLDVGRWLDDRHVAFKKSETADGWNSWEITCPFDNGHGGRGEPCIMQAQDGRLAARCQHRTCTGRVWKDFKQAIGIPDAHHYDPPLVSVRIKSTTTNGGAEPRAM